VYTFWLFQFQVCRIKKVWQFLSDSEWKEQIKIQKLYDYETSEGLLTLRFDVTEYQDEENEFCRTIITRDKDLDILRTRSINNLTRDNLIMDFTSLLGDEATSDIKISVSCLSDEGHEVNVSFQLLPEISYIADNVISTTTPMNLDWYC